MNWNAKLEQILERTPLTNPDHLVYQARDKGLDFEAWAWLHGHISTNELIYAINGDLDFTSLREDYENDFNSTEVS